MIKLLRCLIAREVSILVCSCCPLKGCNGGPWRSASFRACLIRLSVDPVAGTTFPLLLRSCYIRLISTTCVPSSVNGSTYPLAMAIAIFHVALWSVTCCFWRLLGATLGGCSLLLCPLLERFHLDRMVQTFTLEPRLELAAAYSFNTAPL
jgi:hypothetical protein